ncbi:hypothetical protein BDR26DRAFT_353408 [Obelidium mucronatum]|nr:hypothetical protein BDR26DRAFT_353408 [Obelidium mucronatum]
MDATPTKPKPSLKNAAAAVAQPSGIGGDAKLRKVAQLALLANRAKEAEASESDATPNSNSSVESSPINKLKAVTQTIIATQQLQQDIHSAEAAKDNGLSPAQALTRLTGIMFDQVPPSIPLFLHKPLVDLVTLLDSVSATIESIKASLDGIIHWEAIVNSLFITCAVFCAWFVGYWNLGLGWVFVIMFFVNGAYRRNMQRVKGKVGVETARILGLKKLENDTETVEWFNQFLKKFWVQYEPSLSASLKNTIDPILASSKPAFLDDLALTVFTLGSEAPRIDQIKTIMLTSDDVLVMEWNLLFVPVDEDGVSKRQKELGNVRHSMIEVMAKLGKGVVAIPIPILVEHIEVRSNLRLEFKFVSKYPHISKIEYMFTETPVVDFTLRPLKGLDMMDLPGLKNSLNQILSYALSGYVSPFKNYIDLDAMFNGTGAEVPVGVLKVTFHEAKGLKNRELAGISDPYVLIRLGGKEVARTKTIGNSLNPYWGQTLFVPVFSTHLNFSHDSPMDVLEFEVFDDNDAQSDKSMGVASSVQLSRWVKLLDRKPAEKIDEVAPAAEKLASSSSTTPTPEPVPVSITETPKSLSCGEDLTAEESETLITEWGPPTDDSGSDVWHRLTTREAISSKDKKLDMGSLRLEMAFLPVTTLEALQAKSTTTQPSSSQPPSASTPTSDKPPTPDLTSRASTDTLFQQQPKASNGILTVTVHSGKEFNGSKVNSLKCDVLMNDLQHPWVLCGSTPAVKKSNNPTWDTPVRFYIANTETSSIKISVKDGTREFGDIQMEVSGIVASLISKETTAVDWYKVTGDTGKIRLTFQWHPIDPTYLGDKSMSSARQPKGIIKFKLVKAKSLVNVEIMGRKSDPYAKIHIGHSTLGATLVKDNTLDPVWNETFFGVVYSKTQSLLIELWDYNNMKKDQSLGFVELKFEDILKFNEPVETQSKDMQKYINDGLKVEFSGTTIRVLAPVYLQKVDLENEKSEKEALKEKAKSSDVISPTTETVPRDSKNIRAALLQRGFLYFDFEYYEVLGRDAHVMPLEAEQYEFIDRMKSSVVKEISRLRKLAEVKVLSLEEAASRIDEVTKKGYVGDMDADRIELLSLPQPSNVMQAHDSGILRFHVYATQGIAKHINGYVDIRLDGETCFSTRIHKQVRDLSWNTTADICIRSIENQVVTIHLLDSKDGENKSPADQEIGVWNGFLTSLLGHKKKWIALFSESSEYGAEVKLNVSLGYLPINTPLSDTIHNSGMLYIDLHSATNLEAVDNGGTSDPYCLVHINDDLVHKTHIHKKNLNPIFNESINIPIKSRLKSTINFILKDYNAIGKHTTMGTAEFDLMEIKSGELLKIAVPLKGARSGQLNLSLFFDYHTGGAGGSLGRIVTNTVDASARLDKREDNAALKLTKGLGHGAVGTIKEIGKQFKAPPKQSQNQTFSAVERATTLGAEVRDLTKSVPKSCC